jgi:hypothetical protein
MLLLELVRGPPSSSLRTQQGIGVVDVRGMSTVTPRFRGLAAERIRGTSLTAPAASAPAVIASLCHSSSAVQLKPVAAARTLVSLLPSRTAIATFRPLPSIYPCIRHSQKCPALFNTSMQPPTQHFILLSLLVLPRFPPAASCPPTPSGPMLAQTREAGLCKHCWPLCTPAAA